MIDSAKLDRVMDAVTALSRRFDAMADGTGKPLDPDKDYNRNFSGRTENTHKGSPLAAYVQKKSGLLTDLRYFTPKELQNMIKLNPAKKQS